MPPELNDVQSAEGREDLVLQPDRLSQDIAFHLDRRARKLLLADVLALEGVQPLDQAHSELEDEPRPLNEGRSEARLTSTSLSSTP